MDCVTKMGRKEKGKINGRAVDLWRAHFKLGELKAKLICRARLGAIIQSFPFLYSSYHRVVSLSLSLSLSLPGCPPFTCSIHCGK
jgi:hypothetical protein